MRRFVIGAAALAIIGCGSQQGLSGDLNQGGTDMKKQDAGQTCAPVPGAARGGSIAEPRSADLAAVGRALPGDLKRARAAAAGIRRWDRETEGSAGASFGTTSYRFGADSCAAELERMAAGTFAPEGADAAVHAEVRSLAAADANTIGAAFDAWVRSGPAEDRAVAALAERIADSAAAHADLQVFVVKAGGATARNAGVAVVDPRSREAIWVFGRAVRMTTDRRIL
jgi:hypothetical protein